jgi:hypothetical protein
MKVNFSKQERKDNKNTFNDLKNGDIFSFGDPKACTVEVYMKTKSPKDQRDFKYDVIALSTGLLSNYSELKKEAVASNDQMFVYKLEGKLDIQVEE